MSYVTVKLTEKEANAVISAISAHEAGGEASLEAGVYADVGEFNAATRAAEKMDVAIVLMKHRKRKWKYGG